MRIGSGGVPLRLHIVTPILESFDGAFKVLFHHYNRNTKIYWFAVVTLGFWAFAYSLFQVAELRAAEIWLTALAVFLAGLGALFPMRMRAHGLAYTFGDFYIFLSMFALSPYSAVAVATVDAAIGATTSPKWSSRIAGPAMQALSTYVSGQMFGVLVESTAGSSALTLGESVVLSIMPAATFVVVSMGLTQGFPMLNRKEHPAGLWAHLGAAGVAAIVSAGIAALTAAVFRERVALVMLSSAPVLASIIVILHLYARQQKANLTAHMELADKLRGDAELKARYIQQLELSGKHFASAFSESAIGTALLTSDGRIQQVNAALCKLIGKDAGTLVNSEVAAHVMEDDLQLWQRHLRRAQGADVFRFELEMRCANPTENTLWLTAHCNRFVEPETGAIGFILHAHDTTARHDVEMTLSQLAYNDNLTGLPNRRRFDQLLRDAVASARVNPARGYALMFIDFDGFKTINDTWGHDAGDDFLMQMASRLKANMRPGDVVARFGGDEFAVLSSFCLPDDESAPTLVADRILKSISLPCLICGHELRGSASIGITTSAFQYETADDALKDADTAMYKAKLAGPGRIVQVGQG